MSEETITIPLSEYEALKKKNEELTQKIEYLLEEFHLAQKHRFGTSSEKNKVNISEGTALLSANRKTFRMQYFSPGERHEDRMVRRMQNFREY